LQRWMFGESKIVVGAQEDDRFSINSDPGTLSGTKAYEVSQEVLLFFLCEVGFKHGC